MYEVHIQVTGGASLAGADALQAGIIGQVQLPVAKRRNKYQGIR
jgi:hypothetical protein